MKRIRITTQIIFLLIFIFLFLQTESKGKDTLGYPVKIFLDFDPLVFISTFLSSHHVEVMLYLSIILILITIFFGRVFCGWICPLGTINNLVGNLKSRPSIITRSDLRRFKYYLLIFLLISAILSLNVTGIFDPLSLLIRSFSISIYPAFNYALRTVFDALYSKNIPVVTDISESIYSVLKKGVLSFEQSFYYQSIFTGIIFLIIVGLNLYEKRFWCKYLCPLGALLGLFSGYSIINRSISEGCNECGACSRLCQGGALTDGTSSQWQRSECIYCFDCDDVCHEKAIKFGFKKAGYSSIDLTRRGVTTSILTAFIITPFFRVVPLRSKVFESRLIRPPGALDEKEFLKRCVRCGECMKVCITNGLQPAFLEAGIEGLWTPILIPRTGYCEFRCTLCGQVCPTGAIKRLDISEKTKTKIGVAMIDTGRCLPWCHETQCIVCEEVCPTPEKAIWFEEVTVIDRNRRKLLIKRPKVDIKLCIGCGICEAKCPVRGKPAIYVISTGESRSKENQILFS